MLDLDPNETGFLLYCNFFSPDWEGRVGCPPAHDGLDWLSVSAIWLCSVLGISICRCRMAYINELICFSVGKKKKELVMGLCLAKEAYPFSTGQTKLTSYEAQARLRNWLKSTTPVIAMQLSTLCPKTRAIQRNPICRKKKEGKMTVNDVLKRNPTK